MAHQGRPSRDHRGSHPRYYCDSIALKNGVTTKYLATTPPKVTATFAATVIIDSTGATACTSLTLAARPPPSRNLPAGLRRSIAEPRFIIQT